jgi:hypothetical protein
MMVIDLEVASGLDNQIEEPMAGEAIEHVVEEWHAGVNQAAAATIDSELGHYICLAGLPADFRNPRRQGCSLLVARDYTVS